MIPRPVVTPLVPPPVKLSKLLFVEGDTPTHFFEALLQHLGLNLQIEIRNFRGVGDFKTFVIDLARTPEFQRIVSSVGVIRDAETQTAAQARQSVSSALTAAGLTPAQQPLVKTSIYILPDDASPGMIETLCMQAVQNETSLAPVHSCVQHFFSCLGKNVLAWRGH